MNWRQLLPQLSRKQLLRTLSQTIVLTCLSFGLPCPVKAAETAPRYNVLFLMADDLNDTVGAYGNRVVQTPYLDQLAAQGLRFDRAYCSATTCIPSRTALLTGLRPQTTDVYGPQPAAKVFYRQRFPGIVTLPVLFKNNGYRVIQVGKISDTRNDDPSMWSESIKGNLRFHENYTKLHCENSPEIAKRVKANHEFYSYWAAVDDAGENDFSDGAMADDAIRVIRQLKDKPGEPFFLGVGFKSPHVDYSAPNRYFDLYKNAPMPMKGNFDAHLKPKESWSLGLRNVFGNMDGFIHSDNRADVQRAYYSCVSFMDSQVGKVLTALKDAGLDKNTIIVFASDHGFLLGNHGHWGKSSFYEEVMRTPLFMIVPGVTTPNSSTRSMVEFIDIYPTLAELCGLKAPDKLDGKSFVPLLRKPDQPWKEAIFSVNNARQEFVRTDRWKLARSDDGKQGWLFDEINDPDELNNLYNDPAHQNTVAELTARLKALRHGPSQ